MVGDIITYPIVSDPMQVPNDPEAPRDVATGAFQVLLHNGAFFQNDEDLSVEAVGFPFEWIRHWKGKIDLRDGGLIGYGWDFSYNKRIVPIGPRRVANGLFEEQAGTDRARLVFYDGQDHAEPMTEIHSEVRNVLNFDIRFQAYVTTYSAAPGTFHQIERYVLQGTSPNPFAGHVNVEPNAKIFYVLREKDGARYVFTCRGQLIYILSRNDTKDKRVRVELRYEGPLNPLTQNPMLSTIIDASGHSFTVSVAFIHRGNIFTNINCQLVSGTYPIPRIKRVSGAGYDVEYDYAGNDSEPILETTTITTVDSKQQWKYSYDSANRLTTATLPNESAKGTGGTPYIVNTYDGQGRVVAQDSAGTKAGIAYAGNVVTVSDAAGGSKEYTLQNVGQYPTVQFLTLHDPSGESWKTTYEHNAATQVTRLTYPKGNGVSYSYAGSNSPVTLGPIRDWEDRGLTYESDLAVGNLLEVTLFSEDGSKTISSSESFEHLYNQTEKSIDPLGNVTTNTYEYYSPGNRGNPVTTQGPPVAQPDSKLLLPAAIARYTYNYRGQRTVSDLGNGHVTSYSFNPATGYLERIDFPGGAFTTHKNDVRGDVMEEGGSGGTISYARNGRGFVTQKTVGPYDLKIRTSFNYDLNNNCTETKLHVEDAFGKGALQYGVYEIDDRDRVVDTDFDVLNRTIKVTTTADGKSAVTTYNYNSTGGLAETHAPPFSDTGEFLTTFKYDSRGLVTEMVEASGTPAALTTRTTYDANDDKTVIERSGGGLSVAKRLIYDDFDRVISSTDEMGAEQVFAYDAASNVVHAEISGSTGEPGGPRGLLFSADYNFDAYKHLISKSIEDLSGGAEKTQWYYDGDLQLVRQKNPNGGETTFSYTVAGHVEDLTDPVGNRTHNVYDLSGNVVRSEQTDLEQVFDRGSASFSTKPVTYVTTSTYNAVGRLSDTTSPTSTQHLFYDSAGEVRAIASSGQGTMSFRYDGFGRRNQTLRNDSKVITTFTPGGLVAESTGTAANGTAVVSHEKFAYDGMGRNTRRTDVISGAYTTFKYDGLGRQRLIIDPNSTSIERTFNDGGLPLTVTIGKPPTLPPQLGTLANGRRIPAVSGISNETFVYDGLGRAVEAVTDQGAEVDLKYDGLGHVIEETQAFQGMSQTVTHTYSPDGKQDDLVYPDFAGGVRLRNSYDALGRTVAVTLDGNPVASYRYSGGDRIAEERLGNGVTRRLTYDDHQRLVREEIAAAGLPAAGDVLWSQTASYDQGQLQSVQEVAQQGSGNPARVLTTKLQYDANGRTTSSQTIRATSIPNSTAAIEDSSIFSEFEGGRLSRMGEYVRNDLSGEIRTARADTFTYTPDGQVSALASVGLLNAQSASAPGDVDNVVEDISKAKSVSVNQGYVYDYKGNLLSDGRFVYSYDFSDHLVHVEDTWSPYRYIESVSFFYDAFGRRIQVTPDRDTAPTSLVRWGGEWTKSPEWFIYDGTHLVEEILRNPPRPANGPVLLARYFFGARSDERIRMDRRPEDDLSARLQNFYLHEDLQGNVRLVTLDDASPAFISNREPPPGTADSAPERPPGDENFIDGEDIRVPYLGSMTRIDGFAGTVFRDEGQMAAYNYRNAYEFSYKLDQQVLRDSITSEQNRLFAISLGLAALPVSPAFAIEGASAYIAQAGLADIILPIYTTALNVGINYGVASYTQNEYTTGDLLKDIGGGALKGVSGGIMQGLGFGHLASFATNAIAESLWTVGSTGRGWDAFEEGALAAAKMEIQGAVVGRISERLAAYGTSAMASLESRGDSAREFVPAGEALPEAAATAASTPLTSTSVMRRRMMLGADSTPEEKLFDEGVLSELMGGTAVSKELGRRIRSGANEVEVSDFQTFEPGHANAYAFYRRANQRIYLNSRYITANNVGRWRTRETAALVVHEGIHHLGLGEIEAWTGQVQFLITRSAAIRAKAPGETIDRATDAPYLTDDLVNMINLYRRGDVQAYIENITSRHYDLMSDAYVHEVVPRDPFIEKTPFAPTGMSLLDQYIDLGRTQVRRGP